MTGKDLYEFIAAHPMLTSRDIGAHFGVAAKVVSKRIHDMRLVDPRIIVARREKGLPFQRFTAGPAPEYWKKRGFQPGNTIGSAHIVRHFGDGMPRVSSVFDLGAAL
jgi:D-serine deaminase-like pyridoxal phosphate-dependent protein